MASNGTIQVSTSVANTPGGSTQSPTFTASIANGTLEVLPLVLAAAFNQFTIPLNATQMFIQFPAGATGTKTLKGVTGDTGIPMSPTGQMGPFPLAPGQDGTKTIGITSSVLDTAPTIISF